MGGETPCYDVMSQFGSPCQLLIIATLAEDTAHRNSANDARPCIAEVSEGSYIPVVTRPESG